MSTEATNGQTNASRAASLASWLIDHGLISTPLQDVFVAYYRRLVDLGVPLLRAHLTQNALHPSYGSVGLDWEQNEGPVLREYEHVEQTPDNFLQSPFYYMMTNGLAEYRERIHATPEASQFPVINDMKAKGATDYLGLMMAFEDWQEGQPLKVEDRPEGAVMSWMSHAPEGFSEADIALIKSTFPTLGLVLKSGTHRQTAETLLGVYLGRDAGRRVLSGEIQRGSSHWIDAVICYFDLQGFTGMSQRIEGETLIELLNAHFGVAVGHIEKHGGEVLKFMGDGLLAIFDRQVFHDATDRALRATSAIRQATADLNKTRATDGLPTLGQTTALHAGRVLYGNIGAEERLDFTVIGPEVNLAARLSDMHRSLGREIIISSAVAGEVTTSEFELISLGRYMLRGIDQPQELFTLFEEGE